MLLDLSDDLLFAVVHRSNQYVVAMQSCKRLRDVVRQSLPSLKALEFFYYGVLIEETGVDVQGMAQGVPAR